MIQLSGILKVTAALTLDSPAVYALFHTPAIASLITGAITWLGGYLILFKEGGVHSEKHCTTPIRPPLSVSHGWKPM